MGKTARKSFELSRVICTNLHVGELQGIGVAWFKGHTVTPWNTIELFGHNPRSLFQAGREGELFLKAVLNGRDVFRDGIIKNNRRAYSIDDVFGGRPELTAVLKSTVVIERSPPTTLNLGAALTKAPGVAIGTFVGLHLAGDHSAYMIVTVPGGILVISSAIAVAKAVEAGLYDLVSKFFKKKRPKKLVSTTKKKAVR